MEFYPKRLRSIDDLEREKKRLLRQKEELEQEGLFSHEGITGNGNWTEVLTGGLETLAGYLPISGTAVSIITRLARRFLKKRNKKEEENAGSRESAAKKKRKNILISVAKDVIGGYLKWKAIELSFKGIKHLLKVRKKKEE
jgi:hypothetical protein